MKTTLLPSNFHLYSGFHFYKQHVNFEIDLRLVV